MAIGAEGKSIIVSFNSCHSVLFEYNVFGDFGMNVFNKENVAIKNQILQVELLFHKIGQLFYTIEQLAELC